MSVLAILSTVSPCDCNKETRSKELGCDLVKGIKLGIDLYKQKRLARFEHCEEAWRGLTMQIVLTNFDSRKYFETNLAFDVKIGAKLKEICNHCSLIISFIYFSMSLLMCFWHFVAFFERPP